MPVCITTASLPLAHSVDTLFKWKNRNSFDMCCQIVLEDGDEFLRNVSKGANVNKRCDLRLPAVATIMSKTLGLKSGDEICACP